MDPNASLAELRELVDAAMEDGKAIDEVDAYRMAELFEALDQWLVGGGFLPTEWNQKTRNQGDTK